MGSDFCLPAKCRIVVHLTSALSFLFSFLSISVLSSTDQKFCAVADLAFSVTFPFEFCHNGLPRYFPGFPDRGPEKLDGFQAQ